MRALITTIALLLLLGGGAFAKLQAAGQTPATDREAIIGVIQSQLDAFQPDNGPLAFSFASPGIKRMFQTSDRFMETVIQGYPPVYRPQSIQFVRLVEHHGRLVQVVQLTGPDGLGYYAYYTMERQSDGTWKIDGCMLEKLPGFSA